MCNGTEGNIYYLSDLCLVFEICEGSKARAIEWPFIRNPLDLYFYSNSCRFINTPHHPKKTKKTSSSVYSDFARVDPPMT